MAAKWVRIYDSGGIDRYVNLALCNRVDVASANGTDWYLTANYGATQVQLGSAMFTSQADADTAATRLLGGTVDPSSLV
jgi:hypothetical protein